MRYSHLYRFYSLLSFYSGQLLEHVMFSCQFTDDFALF